MKKLSIYLTALLFASFSFTSCDEDVIMMEDATTVVDLAVATSDLSMLVDAVTKAGLVTTLSDLSKQYTVFAPTNAAFTAFLADKGFNSLDDVPVAALTDILLFHVLGSEVKSTALTNDTYVKTLNTTGPGDEAPSLYVDLTNGVKLNGTATVSTANVDADNGVVHIINKVMEAPTVVDLAIGNPNFTSLVAALTRADLTTDFVGTLSGAGPFTVFAPTNTAFQALLDSNNDWNSLADIPLATLEAVLKYHAVSGANVKSSDLTDEMTVTTLDGTFTIDLDNGTQIKTTSSQTVDIIITDVQGTNGIIHAIVEVLIP